MIGISFWRSQRGNYAQTEYYDGTSWTEQADLANAKQK
jgi:hypothetical protein